MVAIHAVIGVQMPMDPCGMGITIMTLVEPGLMTPRFLVVLDLQRGHRIPNTIRRQTRASTL